MIANARMYAVSPAVGDLWHSLFAAIASKSGVSLTQFDHPAPAPLAELWDRSDMAAVFMCGLPYSRTEPRPFLVAAPVPSADDFADEPCYWSEFVVGADSRFERIEETFGSRIALTEPGSQSGCAAALTYFMPAARALPLFGAIVGPTVTPLGSLTAVIDGLADVAPIDAYAFELLRRYRPELIDRVRSIARTPPTPIPLLVSSKAVPHALQAAFLEANRDPALEPLMTALSLRRFACPDDRAYSALAEHYAAAQTFWRTHPFAASVPASFAP